jgi:hypothetical protein
MTRQTHIYPLDDAEAQARWEALRSASPQRCAFAALPYARAAAGASGLRCEIVLVAGEGGDEAGALVFHRRRGPYREGVVPPFTAFTPLLLRTPPDAAAIHARNSTFEAVLGALESHLDVARLHLPPALTDVRPARWRGWDAAPLYTYRLALAGEPELTARWSSGARRTFRKARGRYRVQADAPGADAVVGLLAERYAERGRALPLPPGKLVPFIERMREEKLVRIFTATPAGGASPEAAVAVFHDGHTAHYWVAGSRPGPAMTVLLGEMLPRLHADGLTTFDFVGANTPSIAEFKRRFSPTLTPYFRIEKIRPWALRVLFSLKRV